jgi:AraC-like DNA-binding protein
MANPKFNLDWKVLDGMLQFNPSQRFCAEYLGCSAKTLERHIRDEHDMTFGEYRELKMEKVKFTLQQTAIQMGLAKDRTLLIFCLKNFCGWTDKHEAEVTNKEIKIDVFSNENPLRKNKQTG